MWVDVDPVAATVSFLAQAAAPATAGHYYVKLAECVDRRIVPLRYGNQDYFPTLAKAQSDRDVIRYSTASTAWLPTTPAEFTALAAWRVNTAAHQFEVKTRTARGFAVGTVSGWTAIGTADGGAMHEGVVTTTA